ncbi:multi-copper polyphenol oxidoreductase [Marinobacter salinus]|uniref:Purine nucleoside phosphorylase n=1 Tax=Marinobacter salinus TaxID=1874317 RepID=A0A1D9GMM3_9GAMM|nr:peptidoglycan editing factor PgeF [Marinobacter salinus]AOY88781.1 multi-copper polyphenol oxidoreductase [Marinobacter salinus]
MNSDLSLIVPEWPAPANVRAVSSTRSGGVSMSSWHSLNLGDHVGDAPEAVVRNRQLLAQGINLPAEDFVWLRQVHGIGVLEVTRENLAGVPEADASFTRERRVACAILTADCLPVVLCDRAGSIVGAAHAGWRGLCAGVLENLVAKMGVPVDNLIAWMGPAIGPNHFEVGPEVREAFLSANRQADEAFSVQGARPGHYMADIYRLARQRLEMAGVSSVFGGGFCTVTDGDRFYSYRRDGQTGRMVTVVWIE